MFQPTKLNANQGELPDTPYFQNIGAHFTRLGLMNNQNAIILRALSDHALARLLSIISRPEQVDFFSLMEHFKPFIASSLFASIKKINQLITVPNSEFFVLLAISATRISSLLKVVQQLHEKQLLTQETYSQSLNRIFAKIPTVTLSTVDKKSRKIKENTLTHSHFTLENSISFFIEHDKEDYLEGSIGKVKKGYASALDLEGTSPRYSLKKYIELPEAAEYARKNTKYETLLGRQSWFFRRGHCYSVVSQWQEGKPLHAFKNTELLAIPVHLRIASLANALSQLEILHASLRTHNDLTPGNFIANFYEGKMALIDFDKVTKSVDANFHEDIEALSFIIKRIFPEISTQIRQNSAMESLEYAISLLISAITAENPRARCTTRDALVYCDTILQKSTHSLVKFDNELIKTIAEQTIFRNTISLEDILRGTTLTRSI